MESAGLCPVIGSRRVVLSPRSGGSRRVVLSPRLCGSRRVVLSPRSWGSNNGQVIVYWFIYEGKLSLSTLVVCLMKCEHTKKRAETEVFIFAAAAAPVMCVCLCLCVCLCVCVCVFVSVFVFPQMHDLWAHELHSREKRCYNWFFSASCCRRLSKVGLSLRL